MSVLPASMASSTCPSSWCVDVEADVEHGRRVGEAADRDHVGAEADVARDGLERDAARHLEQGSPPAGGGGVLVGQRHAAATSSGDMLSSRMASTPASSASCTWSRRSHSTWTVRAGQRGAARRDRVGDAHAGPGGCPSAGSSRRGCRGGWPRRRPAPPPSQAAQAGGGLAGVPDPGAHPRPRPRHEAAGEGGDAREMAEEVEGGALAGEDRAPAGPRPCRRSCPPRPASPSAARHRRTTAWSTWRNVSVRARRAGHHTRAAHHEVGRRA